MIEKTPFPKFDGNQESWEEFRRLFKVLMTESGQGEVLEMANCTDKLPLEEKKDNSRNQRTQGGLGETRLAIQG